MNFNSSEEGKTHINLSLGSKSLLGWFLSPIFHTPFIHPEDGSFHCIQGYWYWLLTRKKGGREELRQLSGFDTLRVGRDIASKKFRDNNEEFKQKIIEAMKIKINNNLEMKKLFIENHLPLTFYYNYNGNYEPHYMKWFVEFLNKYREELKSEFKQLNDEEWLGKIIELSSEITGMAEQVKQHYKTYGADGTYLAGQMHLLTSYKELRKFLRDTSHEAYRGEL